MGDGLLPSPRRVAAFLDTVRLDPDQAGTEERPYYRQKGRDFPALLERLVPYVPGRAAVTHPPGVRFTQAQATAYHHRVLASLTVQGVPDLVIDLSLRAYESVHRHSTAPLVKQPSVLVQAGRPNWAR